MSPRRHSVVRWSVALAVVVVVSVFNPDPAYAQNLESFASKVRGLRSSTLLRTLTDCSGLRAAPRPLFSVTIIIGIAIVFSADSIVGLIAG